jgi:hypothetical protein
MVANAVASYDSECVSITYNRYKVSFYTKRNWKTETSICKNVKNKNNAFIPRLPLLL